MPVSHLFTAHGLKDAGAEDRIWPIQFCFRSGCGCADALVIARRKVENAWARKNGNLLLLALDWAKVFDSISPASLVNAMSRLGIPYFFIFFFPPLLFSRRRSIDTGLLYWAASRHRLFLYWPVSRCACGREGVSPDLPLPCWEATDRHGWARV